MTIIVFFQNLADQDAPDDPLKADNGTDKFVPYTAVGSHEDIHKLSKQHSVQELLTTIESRGAGAIRNKPVPKPRKSIPSIFQEGSSSYGVSVSVTSSTTSAPPIAPVINDTSSVVKETPKVKPKPSPRPSTEPKPQKTTPTKQPKPKVLPKPTTPPKPTIIADTTTNVTYCNVSIMTKSSTTDKPTTTISETITTETLSSATVETSTSTTTTTTTTPTTTTATPTTINIEYKVEGENQQTCKKKKQQSTKSKGFEAEPYIVVTLQNPDSSPSSPVSTSPQPDTEDAEYSEIPNGVTANDEEYLVPVDVGVNNDTSKPLPNANKSKTMGATEKRVRMKNKSKSVVITGTKMKTNNPNHRASLPEINNPAAIENAQRRRDSEHGIKQIFYYKVYKEILFKGLITHSCN